MGSNYINKVAIVGAGGNSGSFITEALIKTGKHTVTALTREGSQSKLPPGVISKFIDYGKPETIVEALKGQDALVITLPGQVPEDTELKLINAAGKAGVKWILPNEWSPDTMNESLVKDVPIFQPKVATRKAIADLGKSDYICVSTGFWYEWSLAIPAAYGIDLINHTATLFDEGETKITTTTWPQVGRAVAGILSLPIKPEGSDQKACLEKLKNQVVYTKSFTVSQKDMLESVFRVTGTKEADWTITKESSHDRYTSGLKEMREGSVTGFVKMLYTRIFYPDGSGDIEHKGTINALLDLPKEDMDAATRSAIERAKTNPWS
ncbi:uncharacterized protein N7482_003304 [Penicillium canariense]|uniref:NmrA-like domain-containing protein n=1 Tax=Penicillium canariense TaxID=189055 RepID=A0A9W9LP69_9EURO|nr:uncharacterized protein N7482_003304 [Penicillium canariense]KAJ5167710.1 hypothetical protein N7482_003304 [Penicillium canariense]